METPQENEGVEDKGTSQEIRKMEQTIAIQAAQPEQVRLYRSRLDQMGQALAHKGTKPTKARAMDTVQGEIEIMEEQLEDLKCSYEGSINMVTLSALPEQHQMTESDLQAGLRS